MVPCSSLHLGGDRGSAKRVKKKGVDELGIQVEEVSYPWFCGHQVKSH